MKIEKLGLPDSAIRFLKSDYTELYPPQADAIKAGLTKGKSVLVSAPTASGKTLIATIAMLSYFAKNNGKVIYLSPLRALASEKFAEFKRLEKIPYPQKIKAAISTGDFESPGKRLENANILVLTNERMDSLIRHGLDWIDDIGLVIADEVHLIGDSYRGPTLEMVLTTLKQLESKPQLVGLSATITNADEISEWMGAALVQSTWRPVTLQEGVYDGGCVTMSDGKYWDVDVTPRGPPIDLAAESVKDGGQSLIFAETRTRSASMAAKAAGVVPKMLTKQEKTDLSKASKSILTTNEPTPVIKTLSELVGKGVAFHHAGLNQKCRDIVETEFRKKNIKILSSTPTLAAGVNLPARRVIISSISRYDVKVGVNMPISVLEYKQLCGRAGRPQYDDIGEAIIIGKFNTDEIIEHYIEGEPEPIESKMTDEKSLRIHLLSLVVTTPGIKHDEISEFFSSTLGGVQSSEATLELALDVALEFLLTEELLIKKDQRYAASEFGKKVSALYIDPMTATEFRDSLEDVSERGDHTLGFLHLITNSEEFFPKFSLRQKDFEVLAVLLENNASELLEPISEYDCNRNILALHSWIGESTEVWLAENLKIESGDMHRMVDTSDWLIYCLRELARQLGRADLLGELDVLRSRLKYGIKEELLDLVKIRGIGRVRARKLYKNGIKNLDDLADISAKKLAEIDKIGPTLADNIKSQLSRR